ncbi:MAG: DegV family protein [Candidatus Pacebacteria bacterium]|nr:DegV family protein [Candidatus Paceibacterota bacterium]
MSKIGIIVDEAGDLPQEIIQKHQIAIVPVKLHWPEIENLPGENTFQKMRELEKKGIQSFGKTSQPSVKDFLDKYNLQFEKFEKLICITITSKLSGTYNSALQAKKFLAEDKQDKVFIVDSLSASGGEAFLVLKAIGLMEQGKTAEEIAKELEEFVPQVHFYVIFDDPKWIEASGRISHLVASLMRAMAGAGIRPVLAIKNGILTPAGLKTGAKDIPTGIFKQFETDVKKLKKENHKISAIITHGDDLAGAQRLKEMIEKGFPNAKVVFLNIVNNVVGAPAGPDALTFAWCEI